MTLFAARGYDQTSVSRIAQLAGVSRASIFWHFGDKATLFRETCRHFLVPFRRSLEQDTSPLDPRAAIKQQVATYERFIEDNQETIRAFVSWVFSSPQHAQDLRDELMALHAAFVRNLERSLGAVLREPGAAERTAATIVSLLHGNMLLTLGGAADRGAVPRSQLAAGLVDRALAEARLTS